MRDKIKIALCLSGEPRSTMAGFSYIYESFLKPNPNYEIDVYIHSWKGFRALDLYNPKKFKIQPINSEVYLRNYLNNLSSIPSILNLYSPYTKNVNPLKNTLLMFSSIKECFDLIEEEYDFYIRARLDLFFPSSLDIDNLLFLFNNEIDIIATKKLHQLLLDDQLAICNYKGFSTYCSVFQNLENLLTQTNSLSPEILLGTHLNNNQIKIYPFYFSHYLIRGTNLFLDYNNFKDE